MAYLIATCLICGRDASKVNGSDRIMCLQHLTFYTTNNDPNSGLA